MGSQTELARVLADEAVRNPNEKKLLLDKRNRNWVPQIEGMMVSKQTIFVTVGAAHLVGPGSVLDILCVRGWKVQRIKTGASVPPPACPALENRALGLAPHEPGRPAAVERPKRIYRFLYMLLARQGGGCYRG